LHLLPRVNDGASRQCRIEAAFVCSRGCDIGGLGGCLGFYDQFQVRWWL
jgi:hypothetical protein